jgi:hypothetical protein
VSDATCAASSAVDDGGIADDTGAGLLGVTMAGVGAGRWDSAAASAAGAVVGNATPAGMILAKADARAGGRTDACCPGGCANGNGGGTEGIGADVGG